MSDDSTIARRDLFAGALGLAALAGFARSAAAADYPASDVEKNNIKLIEDFSKAFDEPKPDVNKILSFMHDDIIWSTGPTRPANKSKAVVGEFLKTVIFKNPARYNLKIGDSFARGPMVVAWREHACQSGHWRRLWIAGRYPDGRIAFALQHPRGSTPGIWTRTKQPSTTRRSSLICGNSVS